MTSSGTSQRSFIPYEVEMEPSDLLRKPKAAAPKQELIKSFWISQSGTFQYFFMLARVLDV
jgi:hypothetical protein